MATVPKEELACTAAPLCISIAGRIDDRGYHMCRVLARTLEAENVHVTLKLLPMVETDWDDFIKVSASSLGVAHKTSPLVVVNDDVYVGGVDQFYQWAVASLRYKGKPSNPVVFAGMAKAEYRQFLDSHPHPHAYMDIAVGASPPARVVFELFIDKCPRTVENFLCLCSGERGTSTTGTKLHYKASPLHRVVKGGWVQGGDIEGGHGDGGQSVFGPTFADECLTVPHSTAGVLAMASAEGPHTNNSQFYVTLGPMPWMDGKRVAFGRVVRGMRTFRVMEKLVCVNQRPKVLCVVTGCGVYTSAVHRGEVAE